MNTESNESRPSVLHCHSMTGNGMKSERQTALNCTWDLRGKVEFGRIGRAAKKAEPKGSMKADQGRKLIVHQSVYWDEDKSDDGIVSKVERDGVTIFWKLGGVHKKYPFRKLRDVHAYNP